MIDNLEKVLLVSWELRSLRRLERVLVPSAYIHDQLRLNGIPAHRLETIPLFVHRDFAPPDCAERHTVVFAGRVEESKGMRQFVDCLSRLSSLSWTAQVVGDGPFLSEAKLIAARYGLTQRVEFLGRLPRSALARVLGAARLVVMPSLMPESFGLTGLEALACGRPSSRSMPAALPNGWSTASRDSRCGGATYRHSRTACGKFSKTTFWRKGSHVPVANTRSASASSGT